MNKIFPSRSELFSVRMKGNVPAFYIFLPDTGLPEEGKDPLRSPAYFISLILITKNATHLQTMIVMLLPSLKSREK